MKFPFAVEKFFEETRTDKYWVVCDVETMEYGIGETEEEAEQEYIRALYVAQEFYQDNEYDLLPHIKKRAECVNERIQQLRLFEGYELKPYR